MIFISLPLTDPRNTSDNTQQLLPANMRSAILPLVLFLAAHSWAQKQCFYPNGLQAKNDFPCDTKAADGPCCGGSVGAFCLTNKLCKGPDGNTIRGSCTSADWSSPECPQFCIGMMAQYLTL